MISQNTSTDLRKRIDQDIKTYFEWVKRQIPNNNGMNRPPIENSLVQQAGDDPKPVDKEKQSIVPKSDPTTMDDLDKDIMSIKQSIEE